MAERINLFLQTIRQKKASHFKKTKKFVNLKTKEQSFGFSDRQWGRVGRGEGEKGEE